MVFQNDILAGAAGAGAGYTIDQSIRFNDNDSAYLSRTSGATGDRQKWTFSAWVKRGNLSSNQRLFHDSGNTNFIMFGYSSNNEFRVYLGADIRTTALFRDPSAWYHLVVAVDTTQATSSDRVKIYQNGVQITSFSTAGYPSLNYNTIFNNSGTTYQISGQSVSEYFDGYISEFHWIDGQALDPTSFGETNDDGVWVPKAYAGTYGTNGFYITGEDSADLGADYSGNGNDFTSSGLTSDDQRGDTPTANHATWNPLFFRRTGSYKPTFADGNLYVAGQSSQVSHTGTTISSSGKHYAEFLVNNGSSSITGPGVVRSYWDNGLAESYASNYGGSYYGDNGARYYNSTSDSQTAPGANRVGIEVDFANNEVEYFIVTSGGTKTSQGGKLTSANGIDFDGEGIFTATLHDNSSRNITAYFEEADWWGTPNAGYKALSTANLPTPAIADGSTNFNIALYTGTGNVTRSVTGVGFQPDLVYNKQRNNTSANVIANAVSGVNTFMATDQTTAESSFTNSIYGYLSSFDSDGYTLTPGSTNNNYWNENAINFVSYNWLAANGTASNTDGSITSTVSANTTAGFSIVSYTGNGSSGATVGHGLSQRPEFLIVKRRSGAVENWRTQDIFNTATDYMNLSNTAASVASAGQWNNTEPTSSVFTLGTDTAVNSSGSLYISYLFHSVEGFSKFGKYTGNGSADGPFVWCGFRPAFILVKEYTSADDWLVYDTSRDTYNVAGQVWRPDSSAAEFDGRGGSRDIDILSNGFKFRSSNATMNGSGAGYIFMAFAEHPFGGDGVAPVPAR
jgi:hypothetical protein